MEHYSERIINISDLESKIRSARATSNLLLKCIQNKEYFRAEKLARQLSLEMYELDEFEFCIEQRKVLIRSTDSDKAEVDIGYILNLDSSNLYKCVQEYIDKIKKPVSESPKEVIETAIHETLLKFGIPKDVIIDDGENFLSQEEFRKTRFVEKDLFFLLRAANSKISDTTYCKENGNETVIVTMENGCKYKIDVTGDSLLAVAQDVINFMIYK